MSAAGHDGKDHEIDGVPVRDTINDKRPPHYVIGESSIATMGSYPPAAQSLPTEKPRSLLGAVAPCSLADARPYG